MTDEKIHETTNSQQEDAQPKKKTKNKSKNSNPLYVVKDKDVHMVNNWIELLIKKWNLEPLFQMLMQIFQSLLDQVQTYPVFVMVKTLIDQWMDQVENFLLSFSKASKV